MCSSWRGELTIRSWKFSGSSCFRLLSQYFAYCQFPLTLNCFLWISRILIFLVYSIVTLVVASCAFSVFSLLKFLTHSQFHPVIGCSLSISGVFLQQIVVLVSCTFLVFSYDRFINATLFYQNHAHCQLSPQMDCCVLISRVLTVDYRHHRHFIPLEKHCMRRRVLLDK